jgi:peptidoglycan/xylan/chitin deacetylase (PgdA/CDA1 family)
MNKLWEEGVKCAVCITVDFDGPSNETGLKRLTYGKFSHGRYSAKRGIPRHLEMYRRQDIKVTFFVPGYDAEQHPDSVRAIHDAGHEVAAHGYLHESFDLGAEEPHYLRKSHDILTNLTGRAPVGWRNPGGGKSENTLKVLRELGYRYDSSEKDADLPFYPTIDGQQVDGFINLPDNTSSLDDFPFYRVSYTPPSEVLTHWKQEFDSAYAEGGFYDLIVHPRTGFGSGSPTRAKVVEELIEYIKGFSGVKFYRMDELANWCLDNPALWRKSPSIGAHHDR